MDFSNRTKQDFLDFDARKNEVMQPTLDEIAQQETQQKANMIAMTQQALTPYGITLTGYEVDFSALWRGYIKGDPAMNEWLGDDERLDEIISEKIANNNNLIDFCNFVIQYEA